MRRLVYSVYARRLRSGLDGVSPPRHLAMVMDGNRRWARQMGYEDTRVGHRYGAEHLDEVLGWCVEMGIRHVTVFVASVDNFRKRDAGEVGNLMRMIEEIVAERLSRSSSVWQLHVAGRLDVLPDSTRHAL
jgi:short-chain Z-isoprenyl diphosphate synthase